MLTSMTNSLIGDQQVAVVDVDEGVLEASDMSRTHLNGILVKIRHKTCIGCNDDFDDQLAYRGPPGCSCRRR